MSKVDVAVVIGVVALLLIIGMALGLDGKDKREACAKLAAEVTSTEGKIALMRVCR